MLRLGTRPGSPAKPDSLFPVDTSLQNPSWADVNAFNELIVVVGESTWQVMQAKKALKVEWEQSPTQEAKMQIFGREMNVRFPEGLEGTEGHNETLAQQGKITQEVARKDGDPEAMFKKAAKIIERSYSCPFLAHNCMEPMNFFADVKADEATLIGPIQTPEIMEQSVSARLGLPLEKIDIEHDFYTNTNNKWVEGEICNLPIV